jgi:ferredoxin like protein
VNATRPSLDERLGVDRYAIDTSRSHISTDPQACSLCSSRPCLTVCPAEVYRWIEDHLVVRYENCLECGVCQIACTGLGNAGLTWRNPEGGFGIQFRHA